MWATFERKFVVKNFQKSPSLVTLVPVPTFAAMHMNPKFIEPIQLEPHSMKTKQGGRRCCC